MSATGQKSVRERYIRVAAIDIVINVGIKNICVAEGHQKRVFSPTLSRRGCTVLSGSDIYSRVNIIYY